MTKQTVFVLIFCLSFVQAGRPLSAHASDDYSSYDDIVRELKASEVATSVPSRTDSDFEAIRIHAGTGFVSTHANFRTPGGMPDSASLNGFEVFMGIDLFSRNWIAEGAARSFNPEAFAGTKIALREFDLKIIHRDTIGRTVYWRGGLGVAARYITFDQKPLGLNDSYTTPATIFLLGLGAQFNSNLSLGADLNYRTALITDTIEKSAVDGNLRLTGTF